ncbi:arylamine N-acetyltransferase, partial [Salmonella enterica subsp. enterica serovar Derby]|nr:arylamine N-acetyltransferase [Salmonella enterica subsp. enterica serovar Derby]
FTFAHTIPFENLDVIASNTNTITMENLQNKILSRSRGGLCYELNTLFYYFLKIPNGFPTGKTTFPKCVFNTAAAEP